MKREDILALLDRNITTMAAAEAQITRARLNIVELTNQLLAGPGSQGATDDAAAAATGPDAA